LLPGLQCLLQLEAVFEQFGAVSWFSSAWAAARFSQLRVLHPGQFGLVLALARLDCLVLLLQSLPGLLSFP
jgi:hypothetical protein